MRLPSWTLLAWVMIVVIVASVGSIFSYTQARERTRELNNIAPLEEGVDIWRTTKLLAGWEEPKLPDKVANQPPVLDPTAIPPTTTSTPAPDAPLNTLEPGTTPQVTEVAPTEVPTEAAPDYGPHPDPRRVTILLMGIDQRQGEAGPFRTDTMMVLSINPVAGTGVMLSLPRDLWVNYPGGLEPGRINNANVMGEQIQYPGGGPEFAKRTVERLLGIQVHYYVMVNFDAFVTIIDAVGDIEVCPSAPIDDPKYPDGSYGYLHVTFDAGCQSLGADRLLQYARTRATEGGDFDRAARQQEVILGVRTRVLSLGGVSSLIDDAPAIWDSLQVNIRTDLSLSEIIEIGLLAQDIPRENIRDASIGGEEVFIRTGPGGEEILVPIPGDIIQLVNELFQ